MSPQRRAPYSHPDGISAPSACSTRQRLPPLHFARHTETTVRQRAALTSTPHRYADLMAFCPHSAARQACRRSQLLRAPPATSHAAASARRSSRQPRPVGGRAIGCAHSSHPPKERGPGGRAALTVACARTGSIPLAAPTRTACLQRSQAERAWLRSAARGAACRCGLLLCASKAVGAPHAPNGLVPGNSAILCGRLCKSAGAGRELCLATKRL